MNQACQTLTEKEKQTLRLLLAGHDAKSLARHLGLSVHTVNERLRDARRKLSATSSKEAARLLRQAEAEAGAPDLLGDKAFGAAAPLPAAHMAGKPGAASPPMRHAAWAIGGLAMLSLAIALLVSSPHAAGDPAASSNSTAPASQTAAAQAARDWLGLVDAGNWQGSWDATATSFRSQNSVETWQSVSEQVRVPLGRVLSRGLTSEESIPAPPNGLRLVRFRTDFANKAGATETISLAREGQSWRVAGYFIE
jgi:DNA-binding CsgD family transcriptional regulator